jgi:pimeloyl-ACP methyl ester carboxylesterase
MDNTTLPVSIREQWPWQPRFARANGWRMHYVDEGTGDPIVLLHGNPSWGFLYRDLVEPLTRAGRRVVIPDMIGFGLSEKPTREEAHSLDGHIANLTALLRQLDLRRITLVCHDWGGPTGLGFAFSNPSRVAALVVMSTWAWPLPAGRVPHAHLSMADDARAARRPLPSRPPQRACWTWDLSLSC